MITYSRTPLFFALAGLMLAALACNFPQPTAARPAPGNLIEANPLAKNRPPAPVTAAPLEAPPPELPRLSPAEDPPLEFGPPGSSPADEGRPRLSGPAQTLDTQRFRIHYTLRGVDAVPAEDANNNQHPDFVEDIARALEFSWQAQIEIFGWPPPPPDSPLGGDDRVDVYLQEIMTSEDLAGYVDDGTRGNILGDNPRTETLEIRASHSFMVLDNDYREISDPHTSRLDFIRAVVAHEFMHVIQYGMDSNEPADWLWEATATWMEDEVYDQINDGLSVLGAPFKSPDSCQLIYGGEERVEDEDNWYGQWLFLRYISERYGHATVRAIWEAAIHLDGYEAIEYALATVGTNLDELLTGYSLALLTRDFEEGDHYPVLRLEGIARPGEVFTPLDGVGQMGADYIEIETGQALAIHLQGELNGLVVGVRGEEVHHFRLAEGRASVDSAAFERLYLIVLNTQRASRERHCAFSEYTVEVTPGGQPQTADALTRRAYFIPPYVEGLLEP